MTTAGNAFQMNMFTPNNLAGLCMNPALNVIQCRINPSTGVGNTFYPGTTVVFSPAVVGDLPVVDICLSGSSGRGVVVYDPVLVAQGPTAQGQAGVVLVALLGSIVTMIASTAINRQEKVGYNNVSGEIQSTTTGYIGETLDIAVNPGDIVRVLISPNLTY
jgi:hypothetical protein